MSKNIGCVLAGDSAGSILDKARGNVIAVRRNPHDHVDVVELAALPEHLAN